MQFLEISNVTRQIRRAALAKLASCNHKVTNKTRPLHVARNCLVVEWEEMTPICVRADGRRSQFSFLLAAVKLNILNCASCGGVSLPQSNPPRLQMCPPPAVSPDSKYRYCPPWLLKHLSHPTFSLRSSQEFSTSTFSPFDEPTLAAV